MAYCVTGPAVGPHGRGHLHEVQCQTSPALAGCCHSCDAGGPCESQLGNTGDAIKRNVFGVALVGAAVLFGFWVTRPKKKRKNPRRRGSSRGSSMATQKRRAKMLGIDTSVPGWRREYMLQSRKHIIRRRHRATQTLRGKESTARVLGHDIDEELEGATQVTARTYRRRR
jgi:hypothetical protein